MTIQNKNIVLAIIMIALNCNILARNIYVEKTMEPHSKKWLFNVAKEDGFEHYNQIKKNKEYYKILLERDIKKWQKKLEDPKERINKNKIIASIGILVVSFLLTPFSFAAYYTVEYTPWYIKWPFCTPIFGLQGACIYLAIDSFRDAFQNYDRIKRYIIYEKNVLEKLNSIPDITE